MVSSSLEDERENNRSSILIVKGMMISHYRIVGKIGAGGMGEVYLAKDTKLNRKVALKFLPIHFSTDKALKTRFISEARAAAALTHPSIITIHEVGEHGDRPFFVMEYVEGKALTEIIRDDGLPYDQAVDIILRICGGLKEAHNAGIVHRDIKPSNIIIEKSGRCRILDFGLAAVQSEERLTKTGALLGTVDYMSPEQLKGEKVDLRSDIFSLGILFFELLTGELPFSTDHGPMAVYSILNEPPYPLGRFKPDLPNELQRTIDLFLEKDKELRYQDLSEVIADLRNLEFLPGSKSGLKGRVVSSSEAEKKSIAIMYFQDFTGDDKIKWLSRGLPHMLITDLEQSHQLNVVSYQRLFDILRLFGEEDSESINIKTATAIAKRAKASRILIGSIFKSGDNIRIDYQLQDVGSGSLLGTGKVTGKEPLLLADELGDDVRAKLDIESPPDQLHKIGDVATSSPEAYRHYIEGVNYSGKYHLEEAEECYNKALEYDPTFAMAYFRVALLKEGKDNPERVKMINMAMKYSDRASQKDRHYINSLNSVTKGRYNVALTHLKQIVKYYPEEKEAYFRIAVIYSQNLFEPKRSLKYFQRSLDIDPKNDNVYNELAYVYNQLGDFKNAISSIKKCISIKPGETYSIDTLGDIYAFNGKTNKAIESYKKALDIRTDYQSLRKLGYLHLLKREYSEAENCFKQLCACGNRYYRSEGRASLSLIHIHKGQFDSALDILKEAEIADKLENYREIWQTLKHLLRSLIFEAQGSVDKAIKEIENAEGIWESHYSMPWPSDYIRFLAKKGDFIKADKIVNSFVNKVNDNDIRLQRVGRFYSGCLEFYRNNFKSAIENLEIASEYLWDMGGPGYFQRKYMLARAYLAAGNYEDSIYLFIKLLSLYSVGRAFYSIWSVKIHYYLGIAYEKSGRTNKATEQYEEFLDTWKNADPGIEEIHDAKTRLIKLKKD